MLSSGDHRIMKAIGQICLSTTTETRRPPEPGHLTAFFRTNESRVTPRDRGVLAYDPESLKRAFTPGRRSDVWVDPILRRA
jgi:hypothetical protein